ncbi:hypothetical protein ACEWY4_010291 [Coilia grayii]|uniref:Solute carrier organic anion transporter family member n=1 Tax=Coilia grayii TaxID=363190 RepID=A0ABD1K1G0_9TELE
MPAQPHSSSLLVHAEHRPPHSCHADANAAPLHSPPRPRAQHTSPLPSFPCPWREQPPSTPPLSTLLHLPSSATLSTATLHSPSPFLVHTKHSPPSPLYPPPMSSPPSPLLIHAEGSPPPLPPLHSLSTPLPAMTFCLQGGILFSTLVFGPACGFILGSVCTKFYVDAIFIDTSKLDITPNDPRWIGAWWGGFLLCGALLFFSALFMFGFPQSLSMHESQARGESEQAMLSPSLSQDYDQQKPSNGVVANHDSSTNTNTNSASCCQQLRVIPKVTKHLLSNPVFTCIILAACMEIAVVAGFAAFLGKYLEQQFNLTTTSANQLLGMTAIPCACLGIFLGGLLVKKLNLSALGAIRMAMLVNLVSTACYVSFLFLGCDTVPVAGVTVAYDNEQLHVGQKPEPACLSSCNCFTSSISPVCGSNGVTYLSSCFAGCTKTVSNKELPPPLSQNLSGCSCISTVPEQATAVPGKCPSPGCKEAFLTFLCVICACSMIGAMAQTPSVIILIRTVSPDLKSYALGVLFLLLRLLGFIPPPLIFGAGIDSTCLFWSTECEARGACLLYDNVSYRRLYVSMAIGLKVIAFLLYTTTWQCLRYNYKKYIKNSEGYPSPTDMFNNANESLCKEGPGNRTKFIYSLEDHEYCENMESVL